MTNMRDDSFGFKNFCFIDHLQHPIDNISTLIILINCNYLCIFFFESCMDLLEFFNWYRGRFTPCRFLGVALTVEISVHGDELILQ